jgi:hypothetical protein
MAQYACNKKLKRAVKYTVPPNTDGTPARAIYTVNDRGDFEFVAIVSIEEAHRWLHGREVAQDVGAPSIDVMLEAIANKLREDVERIMLECASNEFWLTDMYRRSKEKGPSVNPVWR